MRVYERIANVNDTTAPPLFSQVVWAAHSFGDPVWMAPSVSVTGHAQKERICGRCGAVRVLVVPAKGDPWREWRQKGAVTQSRWPIVCEVVGGGSK